MIPIYKDGKRESAKYCIDAFEFPNKPCELPLVWTAPSATSTVCAMQGKRLCTQQEWNLACRADPDGGPDSTYAYGTDLDMTICNTSKPHPSTNGQWNCRAQTAQIAWQTCSTDTEPSGAFPKCRSRFGVFDQHGNVAEVMTRADGDAGLVSQLKGSAFFYIDVARKHNEPQPKDAPRETYPDHCNYDPRWHVESMKNATHVNYHLGFRCCKSI
jgi:formylglycine-generating enzyme